MTNTQRDHDGDNDSVNKHNMNISTESTTVRKRSISDQKSEKFKDVLAGNEQRVADKTSSDNICAMTKIAQEPNSSFSSVSKKEAGRASRKTGTKFCANDEEEAKYRRERRLAMNRRTAKIRRDLAIDRLEQLKTTYSDLISRSDVLQKENEGLRKRIKEVELVLEKQNIDYKDLLAKKSTQAAGAVSATSAASAKGMQEQDQLALLANSDAFSVGRAESSSLPRLQSIFPTPQTSSLQGREGISTISRERPPMFNSYSLPLSATATPMTGGIMNHLPFLDNVTNQLPSLLGMMAHTPQQNLSSSLLLHPNQHLFHNTNQRLLPNTQGGLQEQIGAAQISLFGGGAFTSRQQGNNLFQQAVPQHYMRHSSNPIGNEMLQRNANNFQSSNGTHSEMPQDDDELAEREAKEGEENQGGTQAKIKSYVMEEIVTQYIGP